MGGGIKLALQDYYVILWFKSTKSIVIQKLV